MNNKPNILSKDMSKEATTLYYGLYNTNKYIDLISLAVSLRLTPNETNKAIKELEDLDLIETRMSIRKKKQK